ALEPRRLPDRRRRDRPAGRGGVRGRRARRDPAEVPPAPRCGVKFQVESGEPEERAGDPAVVRRPLPARHARCGAQSGGAQPRPGASAPRTAPMVIVDDATAPRARRLVAAIGVSALAHGLFALLVFFDVMGIGSGLGLGVGPGFGVGSGGGAGLGEGRRREIFSLQDVPEPVPPTVVDSTGSMQSIIDDLKRRMDDLAATLQRLVPTARVGAVAYRDRDEAKGTTGPRESEDFVVRWTDLTFNVKKVQAFFNGLVAEGGGDWP